MCVRRGPAEHFEIKWGQLQIQKRVMYTLHVEKCKEYIECINFAVNIEQNKWEQVPICSDGPEVEQETHTPGIYRNI